ncbi:MAG: rhodanese-like domain-containing protein [Trueperaceae bacterium]
MRSRRGVLAIGLEAALAALLLGAAAAGVWQLNRPLPGATALIVREIPEGAVVIDARGPLAYRQGHLPDARRLWARDLLSFGESAGALAQPSELERKVRSLGLEPGGQVVVYDDGDGEEAALVLLVLRSFGFDARLLQGGVTAWLEAGSELSDGPEPQAGRESGPLEFDRRLIVEPDEAHVHIAENEVAPLDVRDRAVYLAGHLEGAVNVPLAGLIQGGEPPRWSALNRVLGPARITEDTHPLVYGENAAQAAMAWLAMAAYGVEHIHVLPDPYPVLVAEGFEVSKADVPAASSTRTSSVCWR